MREFKLRQWYPTLPTEWVDEENIVVVKRGDVYILHPNLKGKTRELSDSLTEREVERNEKFWVEVKPQEFQVLRLTNWITTGSVDVSGNPISLILEYLSKSGWQIHSVKRVSDDEIFTLGDRVFYFDNTFVKWDIDNFQIAYEDGRMLARSKNEEMVEYLDTLRKVESVAFESYDGYMLDNSSDYYVVNERFNPIQNLTPQRYPSFTKNKTKYFVFARKELAERFMAENKIKYSAKDVLRVCNNWAMCDLGINDVIKFLEKQ